MFTRQVKDSLSGCCSEQAKGKMDCPLCHKKAKTVLAKTLTHLLTDEAKVNITCLEGFYYCKTATCELVYFREDTYLKQIDMSVTVGLKEGASPATVCYCFDWTKEKIEHELEQTGCSKVLENIKEKMQNPGCSCEVLNPSGQCCLADVKKMIKELRG